ncbi:MAG: hypothetical protein IJY15_00900 [Thermoguttaceae bacterium]|nr:hypothetical protein [Thermoguttaceae bacterium]
MSLATVDDSLTAKPAFGAGAFRVSARRGAVETQPTPPESVDAENLYVTDAYVEYLRPLIGELPKYVKLF